MEHQNHCCNHSNCVTCPNESVRQTLSEMDWERGIWNAAFSGDLDRINKLIGKAKNSRDLVNSLDNAGYTALHYAARNGHINICNILLSYGAYIDSQTRSGKATPLYKAAVAGKEDVVKLLIQHGAKIDLQDADGKTPLHKAAENKKHSIIKILLEACPTLNNIRDNKGHLAIV